METHKLIVSFCAKVFLASRTLVGRFGAAGPMLCLRSEAGGQLPSGEGGCSLQKCHCTEELMFNLSRAFGKSNPFVGEIPVGSRPALMGFQPYILQYRQNRNSSFLQFGF